MQVSFTLCFVSHIFYPIKTHCHKFLNFLFRSNGTLQTSCRYLRDAVIGIFTGLKDANFMLHIKTWLFCIPAGVTAVFPTGGLKKRDNIGNEINQNQTEVRYKIHIIASDKNISTVVRRTAMINGLPHFIKQNKNSLSISISQRIPSSQTKTHLVFLIKEEKNTLEFLLLINLPPVRHPLSSPTSCWSWLLIKTINIIQKSSL